MHWLVDNLRTYPELAIFLTLGLGYWVGNIKIRGFSLGAVTGTLLVGVLIGQLGIEVSAEVKAVFFLLFLFNYFHFLQIIYCNFIWKAICLF